MTLLRILIGLLIVGIIPSYADNPTPWYAEWIWHSSPTKDIYFRYTFDITEKPSSAKLAITADNIYTLYINGVQVGHDETWETLEAYDILKYLKPGRNIIAVHAKDPGPDIGGLLVEGSINYASGKFTIIKTDTSWKMAFTEKPNWTSVDFDDSDWGKPASFGKPPVEPWGGIEHPNFIPSIHMSISNFQWPAGIEPGQTGTISFTAKVEKKTVIDGPIILRLFLNEEKVWEHWMEPPIPLTQWEPGQLVQVSKSISIPNYLPKGTMTAQITFPGISSESLFSVTIGRTSVKPDTPAIHLLKTQLWSTSSKHHEYKVRLRFKVLSGRSPEAGMYIQLWKGKELWYADTVPIRFGERWKPGSVIEEILSFRINASELPLGTYLLTICLHKTRCEGYKPVASITLGKQGVLGAKPLGYGKFVDRYGVPHHWYITRNGVNIWDGKPYIPVGAMYLSTFFGSFNVNNPAGNERNFLNDIEKLKAMRQAGITDLYLNPCCGWKDRPLWVWQRIADLFEEMGFNYGLQITQETGTLKGFHITTEQNNVYVSASGTYGMEIHSGGVHKIRDDSWAIYSVLDTQTGDLITHGKARSTIQGDRMKVEADVTLKPGQSAVVHFTPFVTFQGDMHDYWSNVNDKYFKELDSFLGRLKFGPGFRLFIDPLDNEQSWRDAMRMLPSPPAFQQMLASSLRAKYKNVKNLTKAWACSPAITSFETAARLVPIGRASENVFTGWAVDLETGQTYRVNLKTSTMWYDIISFRDWSIRDFNNIVADRIKRHHNVPVVLKLTDNDSFTNNRTFGGFDGVGMEAYGSQVELIKGCGGGVYSRSRRAGRTMWELVTETGLAEDYVGYPTPLSVFEELGAMVSIGAKGAYIFYLNAGGDSPGQGFYIFNLFCDMRQLGWVGAFSRMMKTSATMIAHEPDVDYMFPGLIPGIHGFAPFDLGFNGTTPPTSIRGNSGKWIVPATANVPPGKRVIVNLEDSPATLIYRQILDELLKHNEVVFVGHRRDLGALSIDKYYTNEFVALPDGRNAQILKPVPGAKILGKTADGKVYWMQIDNLTIYSKDDWQLSVREMAGQCKTEEFITDILGCRILDLGPAFQAITNGKDTFIWYLGSKPSEITVNTKEGNIVVHESGNQTEYNNSIKLKLKPHAENTVHIVCKNPSFTGLEEANAKFSRDLWTNTKEKALKFGVNVTSEPLNWRKLYLDAIRMQKEIQNVMRTINAKKMTKVEIDGDLSEWKDMEPVYPAVEILRDFSRTGDFKDAEFFLGWDSDNIYIAARVKDDSMVNNYRGNDIWNGDAIEVFIETDPENDPTMHSYDYDTWQFLFSPTNADGKPDMAVAGNPGLRPGHRPQANRVAAKKLENGWQIECAINAKELRSWHPKPGEKIGFAFALDLGNSAGRQHQYLSYGKHDITWNRRRLGRLTLTN
jgi:hypothetical protein